MLTRPRSKVEAPMAGGDNLFPEGTYLFTMMKPTNERVRTTPHDELPEFMTDDDIGELVKRFKIHGKLDVFYREYMNIPAATEDASFQSKHFQDYWEGSQEFQDEIPEIENIILADPAKTAKMQSADSAIIGVGINLKRRKIYIRECLRGKMYPDEFFNAC